MSEGDRIVALNSRVYALLVVCLGFVLFRSADLAQAAAFFCTLFAGFSLTNASSLALCRITPAAWLALLAGIVGCMPLAPRLTAWAGTLRGTSRQCVTAASFAGAAALFVLCLLATAGSGFQPFIYARF